MNQSVILRKRQAKEPEPKEQGALTPVTVFETAYNKVWSRIDIESQDHMQSVSESILTKLQAKKFDASVWEFQSIENMTTYIKGSIKKRQIKTEQSHAVAMRDSLDEVYENIPDWKRVPGVDLYNDIREAKKKGTKKDLFTDTEKGLITAYLEEGETIRDIAKETGQKRMTIQRQLEAISQRIAKLPIRDLYGFIESQGIKQSIRCINPESRPLVTRIGLLRRYRRTKNVVWLTKYQENSERVLTEHECRISRPRDRAQCFENGRELQVDKAQGVRVTVNGRRESNQLMIDHYHLTRNGVTLHTAVM